MNTAGIRFQATKMLHTVQGPQLFDVQFEVLQGQTLALYGPSGAGKTTLLRILAGLTNPATGHIVVNGETWFDDKLRINKLTRHRSIGFVFQDFALFPHLTVRQQLEYALPGKEDNPTIVKELLNLMELEILQHHRPTHLSGGQQQRIAIARAIARQPQLLLLDEPLSAVDDEMRHKLQDYLLKAQQRYQLTTILVSHYLPEIFRLTDTVISLKNGRIDSQGPPAQLFSKGSTGTVIAVNNHFVSVRFDEKTIQLQLTAEEAASFQPGQQVIVSTTLLPIKS